jgi:hypothetical protein
MTELDEQLAANAALVEHRVSMGDLAEQPRSLDHMAYFPKKAADAAVADLRAANFQVDTARKGFRRVRVEFSRTDAADLDSANAFTREILDIVDRHGGDYDGWAGFIITDPSGG